MEILGVNFSYLLPILFVKYTTKNVLLYLLPTWHDTATAPNLTSTLGWPCPNRHFTWVYV